MSFLQPANAASSFHKAISKTDQQSVASDAQQRRVRKSQSNASFLSPLVDLARHPTRPLEEAWNAFRGSNIARSGSDENHAIHSKDLGQRELLYLRMREAQDYEEWRKTACELDALEGNETWKKESASDEYDVALVQARLKQLEDARISCDAKRMLFLVRTCLTRGLGGMGDLRLYKHSHIGTKELIERYIESAQGTLETLLNLSDKTEDLEPRHVLERLLETRQAFGRSALLLSGGGTFGMNHAGVVKALWEAKLLPRIISGSSAGSIVCAVLCTKTDDEVPAVLDDFCYGDLAVFEKEGEEEGILQKLARFMKHGSVFDIAHLTRVMRNMLGDLTFQEAYNRTRRILNISVSSESIHELPRLLNYVTAPNVVIWSAVAASCSVPLVFTPAHLLAKDLRTGVLVDWHPSPQRWIDGSVDSDLPMTRLAEMFNVNHFIVSQVNPHVVPFLSKADEIRYAAESKPGITPAVGPGWLHTMADLARGEALHRMHVLAECGVFPNYFSKAQSVLSQKYSGDITILPEISYAQFPKILTNPTTDFMLQAMLSGERATWPKLSRIQNHCAIELALDQAISQMRSRTVFSASQVDLRLNSMGHGLRHTASTGRGPRRRARASHRTTQSVVEPQPKRPRSLVDAPIFKHSPSHLKPFPTVSFKSPMLSAVDMLSSSAEDDPIDAARLFTDDTDDNDSYSSSDNCDLASRPELWPSTRQLFPSASQPATPFFSSRLANNSGLLGMTPRLVVPSSTSLTSKEPSSPEARYKKLFHGQPDSRSSTAGTYHGELDLDDDAVTSDLTQRGRRGSSLMPSPDDSRKPRSRRGSGKPLKIDISGTRGMLLRMKRSMSTGVKGLRPPGQQ